jgi:quercetin dioxygenase-like cupin family protein
MSGPVKGSPRPTFDGPALIRRADVTRHVWGEPESGEVFDWIYASTAQVHCLVFGVPPGGAFRHSEAFRTVFGADELLRVLEGVMVLANPETGEVVRVGTGEHVSFRRDTWHHAFALGPEPLRVLELFAPPPAAGASSAYARTRPYLAEADWRYDGGGTGSFQVVREPDVTYRRDLGILEGRLVATEHITVHTLELGPGERAAVHAHAGDELLFCLDGPLWVRAWWDGGARVFELGPEDAVWLPEGAEHEYRNPGAGSARAVAGVAPDFGAP